MPSYVAFLRAVNVAPRWLRMERVRTVLTEAGFSGVETHIQSGNVLVRSRTRRPDTVAARIREVLSTEAGFDVPALVRTPERIGRLVSEVEAIPALLPDDPRRYVAFASEDIPARAAGVLAAWDAPGERAVVVGGDHVVIDLTVGAHRARLGNARAERLTGTVMTTRDIKVVRAVAERWSG